MSLDLGGTLTNLGNLSVPVLSAVDAEVDAETCQLLGGFALVVQAIMGIIVIGSLLLKRGREKPRRKWRVWLGCVKGPSSGATDSEGSENNTSSLPPSRFRAGTCRNRSWDRLSSMARTCSSAVRRSERGRRWRGTEERS